MPVSWEPGGIAVTAAGMGRTLTTGIFWQFLQQVLQATPTSALPAQSALTCWKRWGVYDWMSCGGCSADVRWNKLQSLYPLVSQQR